MDQEIPFATPLQAVDWNSGATAGRAIYLKVKTRPSKLYGHLFAALGEFAGLVVDALIAVAIFFAVIELIALIIGTRMTRTVTARWPSFMTPPSTWIAATSAIASP